MALISNIYNKWDICVKAMTLGYYFHLINGHRVPQYALQWGLHIALCYSTHDASRLRLSFCKSGTRVFLFRLSQISSGVGQGTRRSQTRFANLLSHMLWTHLIIFKCSPDRFYQKVAFDNHYVMKFGNRANFMSILCKSQTAQNTACCTIPKWPLKDHKNVSKTLKADPERK